MRAISASPATEEETRQNQILRTNRNKRAPLHDGGRASKAAVQLGRGDDEQLGEKVTDTCKPPFRES